MLHSATMVKAGVYLAARLNPLLEGVPLWSTLLMAAGVATALACGWLALQQFDAKRLLAYSTAATLGMMLLLLGFGGEKALLAALVLLTAHALYKCALFLTVGAIDHCTGVRDVREMGGLARLFPLLAITLVLASLSFVGAPPTSGFLAKEAAYEAVWGLDVGRGWAVLMVVLANAMLVAMACVVAIGPLIGKAPQAGSPPARASWRLTAAPLLLAVLGCAVALAPAWLGKQLIDPALVALGVETPSIKLKLWHGWQVPFWLSVGTWVLGAGVYLARGWFVKNAMIAWLARAPGPTRAYECSLWLLKSFAVWQTNRLQHGRLRDYVAVVIVAFTLLAGATLWGRGDWPASRSWLAPRLGEWFIPVLIGGATWLATTTRSRLTAVCALGVIGYAVAMLFAAFNAPDLAMTQLAVESLTVLLFVLVLYRMPAFKSISTATARGRDAVMAVTCGAVMSWLALAAAAHHAPSPTAEYYAQQSLQTAQGANIVNVILVDFRGLDTLGEIVVLATAALGVMALMRIQLERRGLPRGSVETDARARHDNVTAEAP